MNNKVVKYVITGVVLYAIFAVTVIELYPQDPSDMDWEDREQFNKKQISALQLSTAKQSIVEKLGAPDITEAKLSDTGELQILFYRTQHRKSDGITTQDECTPLLFKDDKLVAWGFTAYEQYRQF